MGTEDEEQPQVAEIRTAEYWAEAKGMLPAYLEDRSGFARPGVRVRKRPNPSFLGFAGAKANWPVGKEMTEAQFDAAIEAVAQHRYG